MPKVLIVTNDFPPRAGGIQSFVHALATRLPAGWRGRVRARLGRARPSSTQRQPFPVMRHPTSLMLPVPTVRARAVRALTRARLRHGCCSARPRRSACWPPRCARPGPGGSSRSPTATRRAGPRCPARAPCCAGSATRWTWSPTWASTSGCRLARALSPAAAARMVRLAPGVDTADVPARRGRGRGPGAARPGRPPGGGLRLPAGAAQGPGHADPRLARGRGPGAATPALLLVGGGPYRRPAAPAGQRAGVADSVLFTGRCPRPSCPRYYDAGDVFAMPCRTRRRGLDVEGLGIVYLEASATGLPVVGGDSGGAPDAVLRRRDRLRGARPRRGRRGRPDRQLLADPAGARAMGEKGLAWVDREWRWDLVAERLQQILRRLSGPAEPRLQPARRGVQRLDVGGEVLDHHVPAHLERRRQVAVLPR